MNCWDLAREFYRVVFGVTLKHYCDEPPAPEERELIRNLIYTNRGDFRPVDPAKGLKFGDLILFKVRGIESHIGIFIEPGQFLHSSKSTGSVIDRLDRWKHLVVGIYRHEEIAA